MGVASDIHRRHNLAPTFQSFLFLLLQGSLSLRCGSCAVDASDRTGLTTLHFDGFLGWSPSASFFDEE